MHDDPSSDLVVDPLSFVEADERGVFRLSKEIEVVERDTTTVINSSKRKARSQRYRLGKYSRPR